ncbi:MAG: serine hydrolase domain-containing protein [Dehalococcoidia bacterium]
MPEPRGLTDAGRARIDEVARTHFERGWHPGAQLGIYRDGFPVLDLRLGDAAAPGTRLEWFSATKPVTAVAVHLLVERGALDLDTPIAALWPEFAQGGKTACTVRHVLTHRGGFPVFPVDFPPDRIGDWDAVTAATAALPAVWEPGTAIGYHPVTYGYALGEVIRRVDGRMPREFFAQEIFGPLGMEASLGVDDVSCVAPPRAMSEVTFEDPEGTERRTSRIAELFASPAVLRAQVPAANAIGTAEALARFYAMLEQGGALTIGGREVRILSPETVAEATRVHVQTERDLSSGLPSSYGLGFIVGSWYAPFDRAGVFGHGGQQSTISYADPSLGLAVAYVTNGLHDPLVVQLRTEEMVQAIAEACA